MFLQRFQGISILLNHGFDGEGYPLVVFMRKRHFNFFYLTRDIYLNRGREIKALGNFLKSAFNVRADNTWVGTSSS